jgi:peptide deformylase
MSDTQVKIYLAGEEILRSISRIVLPDEITGDLVVESSRIAHKALKDFREKNGFGRAISAPQVGYGIQMIALHLDKPMTIFNPVITKTSPDTFTMWDDCLSFPDLMCCVRRYRSISIRFMDENGEERSWNDCDIALSELLQHEIDHLNGILALDIAISPEKDPTCQSIVKREDWMNEKDRYNSYVDYSIS